MASRRAARWAKQQRHATPASARRHAEVERGLFIYTQGQGVFDDQRQMRVASSASIATACRPSSSATAARSAAKRTCRSRPKRRSWPGSPAGRSSSRSRGRKAFRSIPKRHPIELNYKIGCDAEGRITAVQARIIGDKGAYASVGAKVLERAGGHCTGPYRVPAIDMESLAVYTNNPPCGAMRGFGANQSAFAIEGLARSAGRESRHRRLRHPRPQHPRAGRSVRHRPDSRQAVRPSQNARSREGRVQDRPSTPASPAASRTSASATACPISANRPCTSKTPTRSTSAPASPKWARACSRSASSSRSKPPACRRRFQESFDRHEVHARLRPNHGQPRRPCSPATRSPKPAKQLKAELDARQNARRSRRPDVSSASGSAPTRRSSATTSTSRAGRRRISPTASPRRSRSSTTTASS